MCVCVQLGVLGAYWACVCTCVNSECASAGARDRAAHLEQHACAQLVAVYKLHVVHSCKTLIAQAHITASAGQRCGGAIVRIVATGNLRRVHNIDVRVTKNDTCLTQFDIRVAHHIRTLVPLTTIWPFSSTVDICCSSRLCSTLLSWPPV